MKRNAGPTNPVSPHPNGFPAYSLNPLENLPVAEDHWMEDNFSDDYFTEPVYSSQAIYGFSRRTDDAERD